MRARTGSDNQSAAGKLEDIVRTVLKDSSRELAGARTLPPAAFTSKEYYDLEVEKIFRREWLCIGHVSQVAAVGDYFTLDMFGEMILVVRGKDRVRVFSRACLHRWAPIVAGEGNAKAFSCPFHGWTYGLDGQLMSAPFMDKGEAFDARSCRLPEIKSAIVESLGLIFITFADRTDSPDELLEDLPAFLENFRMPELVQVQPADTDAPFNWKILLATGMEAYHHFAAHRGTFERTNPTRLSWCEDGRKAWSLCHSGAVSDMPLTEDLPFFPGLRDDQKRSLDLYHIFPLTRLVVFPDSVRFRIVIPDGPTRTKTHAIYLVRPEVAAQGERLNAAFEKAQVSATQSAREDFDLGVMQQRGAGSALASPGAFCHLEASLWHFAEYMRARIAAN